MEKITNFIIICIVIIALWSIVGYGFVEKSSNIVLSSGYEYYEVADVCQYKGLEVYKVFYNDKDDYIYIYSDKKFKKGDVVMIDIYFTKVVDDVDIDDIKKKEDI